MYAKKRIPLALLVGSLIVTLAFTGCSTANGSLPSNDMEPDYDTVFNQSEVMEINIVIDSADWAAMQEDVASSSSTKGQVANQAMANGGDGQNVAPGNLDEDVLTGARPNRQDQPMDGAGEKVRPNNIEADAMAEGAVGGMPGQVGAEANSSSDPIWVESSITVNGLTWDHVGIRYKGNSSLKSAVSSGNDKLSFKLDFDEFEDLYPEIENQRFYGFKQLNLNNNYGDASLMHDKIAADLFNEFGVPAATTSFCVVNVDYGQGSQYYGVYVLVEEMDDTGIAAGFTDDSGNLYKPEGTGATFADGSYNYNDMNLKSNEDEADYSDVNSLYEILNSDIRETDVALWQSELEDVFNVDGYLKYLAANNVIQNWDTYGTMNHNYYLYNDPSTNLLNWIPWDNNEAFTSGKGNRSAISLEMTEVNEKWPIIRYLIDNEEYKAIYDGYLKQFIDEVFTVDKMTKIYDEYYELLKEYAYAEVEGCTYINSDDDFDRGVEALKTQVVERNTAVENYLK